MLEMDWIEGHSCTTIAVFEWLENQIQQLKNNPNQKLSYWIPGIDELAYLRTLSDFLVIEYIGKRLTTKS
jgi:hypothetical protein